MKLGEIRRLTTLADHDHGRILLHVGQRFEKVAVA